MSDPLYEVTLTDIGGGNDLVVPLAELQFNYVLNTPGTVTFKCPMHHPDVVPANFIVGRREVYVRRDGDLVWAGRLWDDDAASGDDTVQFSGEDWLCLLDRRFVLPPDILDYVHQDVWDSAWDLITYAQDQGDLGITRGTPGTSGRGEHALFEFGWWDARSVLDLIGNEISNRAHRAFFYRIDANRNWLTFNRHFPTVARSGFTLTSDHIERVSRNRTARESASQVYVRGGGSGEEDSSSSMATNSGAVDDFGLITGLNERRGTWHQPDLDDAAAFWSERRAHAKIQPTVELNQDTYEFGTLLPADYFVINWDDGGYLQFDPDAAWLVASVQVEWAASGHEKTTITADAKWDVDEVENDW